MSNPPASRPDRRKTHRANVKWSGRWGSACAIPAYIALQQSRCRGKANHKTSNKEARWSGKSEPLQGSGGDCRSVRAVRVAYVALGTAVAAGPAHAAADAGCQAINSGALNVELGTESSATRAVALKAGDTLTFNFDAPAGPFGSLELLKGPGAPRSLLVGPSGTNVSFVAAKAGAFDFEFSKEGAEAATFAASCMPAGAAPANRSAAAARRSAKLFGGTWNDAGNSKWPNLPGSFSMPAFRPPTAAAPAARAPRPRRTQARQCMQAPST